MRQREKENKLLEEKLIKSSLEFDKKDKEMREIVKEMGNKDLHLEAIDR